jgi:hypothetical protein
MTAYPVQDELQEYVYRLGSEFKQAQIIICGNQVKNHEITLPSNVIKMENIQDFITLIEENKHKKTSI